MILFSLFYFVPENEKDMFSGFGLFRGGIVHFQRKKSDFCTKRGWDCAFQEGKKDFCKININKKDASEWGIGTATEQISCFVKFYLTELL